MSDYNIREAFEKIEDELIDSMMRNFSRHRAEETKEGYNWTQWQAEQLKSLEEYRKHNAKKFGKRFKTINSKVEEMIRTAKADGNASQEAEILEAVKDGFKSPKKPSAHSTAEFFKVNDRKLDALIKSTTDDLKRAETAVLRMSNDKYRKAIFNAQVAMNTGAVTYEKAVDIACKDMLNAGLNCVEYKNGARHMLSDYADMAVKTANKRAYLRGEGEKRAEWGVSLVVVNSRQGGCPDCAKYIGKVFIDDVYSNGKKSDGNYPLLSTAIKNGLFHPRCKDSTSTYYEEITTLEPVTPEEEAEMDRRERLEEKQQYAERQAERFDRRAEYSLDEDNKRIAQTRADEWHDRADMLEEKVKKAGNVNKISDEAVAKSAEIKKPKKIGADEIAENTTKLKSAMTETDYNKFTQLLADSENESVKKLYVQYADEVGEVLYKENQGGYMPAYNRLIFSYEPQWIIDSGVSKYSTVAHEYAHFFDQKAEFEGLHFSEIDTIVEHTKYQKFMLKKIASSSDEFLEAARKDREFLESLYDQDPYELRKELLAHNGLSGSVQDAFDGLLGVRIKQGHGNSYYNKKFQIAKEQKDIQGIKVAYKEIGIDASNQGKVMREYRVFDASSEMWANIMSAEVNGGAELEYIKKYLPNSYNAMRKIVDNAKFSGDTVEKSVDYMSKSFRPKFSPPSSIDFNNNSIKIKKVENSKFDIVTDIENTRRNKAVRLTEKLLDSISNNLPVEMELPKVAVIDFEKNNFGIDAIGGYDKSTGILYINSKYDTASKIISYVNKQKDMFANKTEFAPLLHELGHKYYYDSIKNLAKVKNIEYNKAKGIIDEKILSYIQNKGISKNLDTLISEYAQSGYDRHKYTEIVAEVFTVPEKELASDLINLVGE